MVLASSLLFLLGTPLQGGGLPALSTELVATGLDNPVLVTAPPGDFDRLFVVEQPGELRVIKQGQLLAAPYLDLASKVDFGGENGLLALAFHPDYATNGHFYVVYNELDGDLVLERYTATPPTADQADAGSGLTLLTIPVEFGKHNGGMLAFGPSDGMLYLSVGDGGGEHDPFGYAQALDALRGKVLRVDVDGAFPYAIPPDNPFAGVPGVRQEIWASGLRNPWRFGMDAANGRLFLGDVGKFEREELNHVTAGGNYGWDCMEGELCTLDPCTCFDPSFIAPIHHYDHNLGCAILGGPAYRGAAIPGLDGRVFFSDYCVGRVWSFEFDGVAVQNLIEHTSELSPPGGFGLLTSFGQDAAGEVYLVAHFPGTVRRILTADSNPDCDDDGTSDSDELLLGTEFDVNANTIPDSCELLLTVDDLVPATTAKLEFIGAAPGDPVAFAWTTRGIGPGPCFYAGAWCLQLLPMTSLGGTVGLLGLTIAGAEGAAEANIVVPSTLPPDTLLGFQAVVFLAQNSLTSNPVQKVIP